MSQEKHRRRARRAQRIWDEEPADASLLSDTPDGKDFSLASDSPVDQQNAFDAGETPEDARIPEEAPEAQEEKKPLFPLTRENWTLAGVIVAALVVAIVFGVMLAMQGKDDSAGVNTAATALPYDVTQPFMPGDITQEQMEHIEQNGGSFALSDYQTGPHGVKIGDTLDTLLERFPVTYTQTVEDQYAWDEANQNMSYLTYDFLETDYQVIYAQRVFYQEGEMVVLPPSGTLSVNSDMILVTLIAPLSNYPEGTAENYLQYPHVYCKLTVDPDTGKITRIVLGKNE